MTQTSVRYDKSEDLTGSIHSINGISIPFTYQSTQEEKVLNYSLIQLFIPETKADWYDLRFESEK